MTNFSRLFARMPELLAAVVALLLIVPVPTLIAQEGEDTYDEVTSPDPDARKLPIEEAMREYNARFCVVSIVETVDEFDPQDLYDPMYWDHCYPWPDSLGCGGGPTWPTPPKPEDGWYGPSVYDDPMEAAFLTQAIVLAFYDGEPVETGGPLYGYFINPEEAIENANVVALTEDDFPLTWLAGAPVWSNAPSSIDDIVTVENYEEVLDIILSYIRQLGATGAGGPGGTTDPMQKAGNGSDSIQLPEGIPPELAVAWADMAQAFENDDPAAPSSGGGVLASYTQNAIGHNPNPVPTSILVGYIEMISDLVLIDADAHTGETAAVYIFVDEFHAPNLGPHIPGMMQLVGNNEYGQWTQLTNAGQTINAGDLVNGDLIVELPLAFSEAAPPPPGSETGTGLYNDTYGWQLNGVAWLTSKYPPFDTSPSYEPEQEEGANDGKPGGGEAPDADLSEDGGAELAHDAGNTDDGNRTGTLSVDADKPREDIGDPSSLTGTFHPSVETPGSNRVIRDEDGRVQQVMNGLFNPSAASPSDHRVHSLVHVDPLPATSHSYAVEYYADAHWDSTNSDWDPQGDPFRRVTVEDTSSGTDGTSFRVTNETFDGQTLLGSDVSEFAWDATHERWVLAEGVVNGVAARKRWTEVAGSNGFRTVTRIITGDNTSQIVSKVEEDYRSVGDGWQLLERRVVSADGGAGPDTYAWTESWTYTSAGDVRSYHHSNGAWVYFIYDAANGRLLKSITPLGDAGAYDPLDPDAEVPHLVTTRRRQASDLNDTHTGDRAEIIQETIQWIEDPSNPGTQIAASTTYRVTWSYAPTSGEYEVWEIACNDGDPKSGYAGADDEAKTVAFLNALLADSDHLGHRVTRTVHHAPGESMRFKIKAVYYPDGTVSLRSRSMAGTVRTRVAEHGYPAYDTNGQVVGIAHGTRTTAQVDTANHTESILHEQRVRGGNWVTTSLSRSSAADELGRVTGFEYFYGSNAATPGTPDYTVSVAYGHAGPVTRTGRRGLTTEYAYDSAGMLAESIVKAGTSGALRLGTLYDPAGRITATTSQGLDTQGAATTPVRTDVSYSFDVAGRVIESSNVAGVQSFYTYRDVTADGSAYTSTHESTGEARYQEQRTYPNDPDGGPIVVTHTNRLGRVVLRYEAALDPAETDWTTLPDGRPTGSEDLVALTRVTYAYDWRGQQTRDRTYFDLTQIPALDSEGSLGTNYIQTERLAADFHGRPLRHRDTVGTISAVVYDADGRVIEEWIGTDDTGATPTDPSGNGTNNLVCVARHYYDDNRDGTGEPMDYATRTEFLRPGLATLANDDTDYTGVDYESLLDADSEVVWTKPDAGPWSATTHAYDDRLLVSIWTQNGSESNLLAKTTWHYDTAGKPWRLTAVRTYSVENFTAGNYLETAYGYDDAERREKEVHATGGFVLTQRDARGRISRILDYADSDTVLHQSETIYDGADRPVVRTELTRWHDDTTTVGPLSITGSVMRVSVNRYDNAGRLNRVIDFGQDNGSTRYVYDAQGGLIDSDSDGIPDEADPDADTPPSSPPILRPRQTNTSDDYRVTLTTFDALGQVRQVTTNDGVSRQYSYNHAGWRLSTTENYIDGVAGGGANNDQDRITQHGYNAFGQLSTIESVLSAGTIENTRYVYASELDDKGGPVADNGVLRAQILADSDDSVADGELVDNAAGYDREEYTYYADHSPHTYKDPRGVVWTTGYTAAGEVDHRRVTATGTWSAVGDQRIGYTYGDFGERLSVTTYSDAAGNNATSRITYTYDGLYSRVTDAQNHNPAGLGGGTDLTVTTGFDTTATGGRYSNGHRRDQLTYPNGRVVKFVYDGHGGIDHAISRPNGIDEVIGGSDVPVARYHYLGSGTLVRSDYPGPRVRLDMIDEGTEGTAGGSDYDASMNSFGQTSRFQWERYDGNGDGAGVSGGSGETILHTTHAYDRVGQKRYDRRHVYAAYSAVYEHDALRRMIARDTGPIETDSQGGVLLSNGLAAVDAFWKINGRRAELDPLGNTALIDTESSTARSAAEVNDGNEITSAVSHATAQIAETALHFSNTADKDVFTESLNCTLNGTSDVEVYGGELTIKTGSTTAPAIILAGEDRGPLPFSTQLQSPANTGLVGMVFGYKSPLDYWVLAINFAVGDGDWEVYHVHDADSGGTIDYTDPDEKELVGSYNYDHTTLNQWYALYARTDANTVDVFRTAFDLSEEGGYPSGRYGLYTEVPNAKFNDLRFFSDGRHGQLGAAWETTGNNAVYGAGGVEGGRLWTSGTWHRHYMPILLRGVRAQRFQATFQMQRSGTDDYAAGFFIFNYRGPGDYDQIRLWHDAEAVAPQAMSFRNGGSVDNLAVDRDADEVPDRYADSDPLWYRVVSDGVHVKVFAATSAGALDGKQSADQWCMRTTDATERFAFSEGPGRIGFAGAAHHQYWDNFTLETDPDDDADLNTTGSYETVEISDSFDLIDGSIEQTYEYDSSGNLTCDGAFRYTYDALGRLESVRMVGLNATTTGSMLARYRYDGLGRLIEEEKYTAEGLDLVVRNLYDGWNVIETRDAVKSVGRVTTQNIWHAYVGRPIDALAQVAHNINVGVDDDPTTVGTQATVDARLYVLQDELSNVTAVVTGQGILVERYEYDANGRRRTYRPGNLDYARFAMADVSNDGDVDVFEASGQGDTQIVIAGFGAATPWNRTVGEVTGDTTVGNNDLDLITTVYTAYAALNDTRAYTAADGPKAMDDGIESGLPLIRHGMQGHV